MHFLILIKEQEHEVRISRDICVLPPSGLHPVCLSTARKIYTFLTALHVLKRPQCSEKLYKL